MNGNTDDCCTFHLEFPPGVEFLQALHRLLPVHHGGHGGPLLQEEGEITGLDMTGNIGEEGCLHISVYVCCVCVCGCARLLGGCVCLCGCVCVCVATYADPGVFEGLCGSDALTGVDG